MGLCRPAPGRDRRTDSSQRRGLDLARLYANENFPQPVAEALRRLGHDLLTIQDTGRAGEAVSDRDVLAMAKADGRAVMTLNRRDCINLHAASADHCGVIVCTVDPDFGAQAARIHQALEGLPVLDRQLIRVNRPAQ